ncbi:hypothetical protein K432DRAFT_381066 [Lepidopterella palustris CBS 459.81]|uniref:Uncharacterized protein n=1 Tax=Lepidopterella palustris CBS 459.81 TaxID=1314670 RepID=A0A8E2JGJ2_9PEZI|nr:hypothetical protein K432DRAFT_381066 [Lepidopterella palustris CBS 459.81]
MSLTIQQCTSNIMPKSLLFIPTIAVFLRMKPKGNTPHVIYIHNQLIASIWHCFDPTTHWSVCRLSHQGD